MTCSCDKECDCNKPKAHPHAELMAQHAEDAKKTDKPCELWQYYYDGDSGGTWLDCVENPRWDVNKRYRRKPQKKVYTMWLVLFPNGGSFILKNKDVAEYHKCVAEIREITWEVEV